MSADSPAPLSLAWDDPIEAMEELYRLGWTDGLPVVPPVASRVAEFIERGGRPASEIVGELPERRREISVNARNNLFGPGVRANATATASTNPNPRGKARASRDNPVIWAVGRRAAYASAAPPPSAAAPLTPNSRRAPTTATTPRGGEQ